MFDDNDLFEQSIEESGFLSFLDEGGDIDMQIVISGCTGY